MLLLRSPLPRYRKFPQRPSLAAAKLKQGSGHALQCIAEYRHRVVDLRALDNQRRREREGVAGVTKHEAVVEAVDHDVVAAATDRIRPRRQLDACDEADGAAIGALRQTTQRM